ncbi:MAG: hypothetical protein ABL986_13990 [Vicinamibacterales bacterium]
MTDNAPAAIGTQYPLLFTYRDTLFGNGFVVEVQAVNGRALCVREAEDEYWVYGINPGGMAAHGVDAAGAHGAFRKAFTDILVDLAHESSNFDEFQAAVQTFFDDTNKGYEADWKQALPAVQRGEVSLEGIETVPANSPRSIAVTVKQVELVTPQDNSANVQYLLAA